MARPRFAKSRTLILVVKEGQNVRSCKPSTLCDLHNDERIFQAVLAGHCCGPRGGGIDELQIETALKPTTASKEDLRFLADSVDSLGLYTQIVTGDSKQLESYARPFACLARLNDRFVIVADVGPNWVSILDNFE